MLEISKKTENTVLEVALKGRLDTSTSPELEQFLSSAGLRVLLSAHKMMAKQGSMRLLHANEVVMEVFEVTGFIDILNIE